jgi:hypothetical protein
MFVKRIVFIVNDVLAEEMKMMFFLLRFFSSTFGIRRKNDSFAAVKYQMRSFFIHLQLFSMEIFIQSPKGHKLGRAFWRRVYAVEIEDIAEIMIKKNNR